MGTRAHAVLSRYLEALIVCEASCLDRSEESFSSASTHVSRYDSSAIGGVKVVQSPRQK